MDNHPIPQDVTNFEFRLIGDMTLKQFGFVFGGVIFAWIMLASPLFFLLKLVLAGGFVLGAVVLAFVPIEGRPADVMLIHFIKALFSPTQFVYQKKMPTHGSIDTVTTAQTPLQTPKKVEEKKEESVQVESFLPTATAAVLQHEQVRPLSDPLPQQMNQTQPQQVAQEEHMKEEAKLLTEALAKAKEDEARALQGTAVSTQAHEKVNELETQLQEVMIQKQELEKQLIMLQKSLEKKQQVFTPTTAKAPEETEHVKRVPKQMSVGAGAPLVPDVPNLITGVVKDSRGNVLSNMLIEVKDKDGNPVRAFKTNQLGQFAAATQLTNGIYTISFEDPAGKQTFDSVELQVDGQILLPLEITSVDAREKLRMELFGTQSTG